MMPPETTPPARLGRQVLEEAKRSAGQFTLVTLTVVGLALGGCATPEASGSSPKPGEGIARYRQLVRESGMAIAAMGSALDRVGAQTNRCPAGLVKAFSREVQRLQAESIRVRSRSQAIQARGDAYFQNWQENLASVKDPQVRALADERRPQLQDCFARIKMGSQKAGEAFRPFLAGLRKLQNALETDAGSVGAQSTRELIRSTREQGGKVEQALTGIGQELDAMTALVTPAKSGTRH
jgi:hypothetical protein